MALTAKRIADAWNVARQEARRGRDLRSLSRYMRRHRRWHKRPVFRLRMIEWATIDVEDMIR